MIELVYFSLNKKSNINIFWLHAENVILKLNKAYWITINYKENSQENSMFKIKFPTKNKNII
jgi:hypothetical protein